METLNANNVLEVKDLQVSFKTYAGEVQAVRDVSFTLRKGETLAIVGESASGKSVTAKSLMGLLPDNSRVKGGTAMFDGRDLLKLSEKQMQKVRGPKIAMVFQDPMTSLDPTMRVGAQITESLKKHMGLRGRAAKERAIDLLKAVHIPNPESRLKQYPHEFSGGMRQRVVIAIALACDPDILICDEPTTALDVTIQEQIMELLAELQDKRGTSIILITHDLGVVAQVAHRVCVMYSGRVIETGTAQEIFNTPRLPYTRGLMTSIPRPTDDRNEDLIPISGSPPNPLNPPKGCPFNARCPYAMKICEMEMPEFTTFSDEHEAACWLHHDMAPNVEPPARIRGEAS
ncbi:MAG: ABC transporter ATP-binding protein [Rubrobacteraceae bacterium]